MCNVPSNVPYQTWHVYVRCGLCGTLLMSHIRDMISETWHHTWHQRRDTRHDIRRDLRNKTRRRHESWHDIMSDIRHDLHVRNKTRRRHESYLISMRQHVYLSHITYMYETWLASVRLDLHLCDKTCIYQTRPNLIVKERLLSARERETPLRHDSYATYLLSEMTRMCIYETWLVCVSMGHDSYVYLWDKSCMYHTWVVSIRHDSREMSLKCYKYMHIYMYVYMYICLHSYLYVHIYARLV